MIQGEKEISEHKDVFCFQQKYFHVTIYIHEKICLEE